MKRFFSCSAAIALVLIAWAIRLFTPKTNTRTSHLALPIRACGSICSPPRRTSFIPSASPSTAAAGCWSSRATRTFARRTIRARSTTASASSKTPTATARRIASPPFSRAQGSRWTSPSIPIGSVYLATRNEILRLRDTDGDGKADEHRRLVFLETKGDYPHNGLSGLAFDSKGNLYFGLGENLGAAYKLIGADGTTLTGGGEGGSVFWCTADGRKLRRVATGFWNPFGVCRDIFGRIFAVDNDPDAMPPCRLVHVVEGGDYGYQFRYGRSGRHPFQSWDGQLPGTLPMVSGTGEAPCEVLSYESDGLPREYLGDLLVTSWADHRVERYQLKERGASFAAERKPFVQGGENFRPVGMAVAPDGSLFVSDWVRSDYNLHGKGAIWHIRARETGKHDRPTDPRRALFSAHRPLRECGRAPTGCRGVGPRLPPRATQQPRTFVSAPPASPP